MATCRPSARPVFPFGQAARAGSVASRRANAVRSCGPAFQRVFSRSEGEFVAHHSPSRQDLRAESRGAAGS